MNLLTTLKFGLFVFTFFMFAYFSIAALIRSMIDDVKKYSANRLFTYALYAIVATLIIGNLIF